MMYIFYSFGITLLSFVRMIGDVETTGMVHSLELQISKKSNFS